VFHVTPYAGHCTFFTAINYAYEELGKLICLVIKLSKFHFYYSLALAFSFQKLLQAISLTFSALKLEKSRNSLLIFLLLISTTDFEKAASYFSTSNPAFSQTYVLRVQPLFSPVETSFTVLTFALSATNFFSADAFAEGYNVKITCCIQRQDYE
jgi:hypothetical protein